MNDYKILKQVTLTSKHVATGRTRHYYGEQLLPKPDALQIVKYPEDPGFYLFYIDSDGSCITDTYHDTLQKAIEQASWEFEVKPEDWGESLAND